MIKKACLYWLLTALIGLSLSGCTLPRSPDAPEDIQVDVPTIAPASATTAAPGDTSTEFIPSETVSIVELVQIYNQSATPTEAQPPGTAGILVEPATQQIAPNGITTAEVWVKDVSNLAGLDIELRFNPAILRVVDASTGQDGIQIQPGDFLSPDFVQTNQANNETGVIRYIMTQVAPTVPANGTGILILITFEAIAPGASSIDFSNIQLVSVDALLITISQQQPGQIIVTTEPMVEATATTSLPTAQAALPTPTPAAETPAGTATPFSQQPTAVPPVQPPATIQPDQPVAESPTDGGATGGAAALPISAPIPVVQPVTIPPGFTTGFCYRTQPGETIASLAQKYATTAWAINLVNDLSPPGYVIAQQTLFIPTSQPVHGPNVYIVEPGDAIAQIAEQCKLPVSMLMKINNLADFAQRNNLDPNGPIITLPMGAVFTRGDGYAVVLAQDTVLVEALIIPIPPFPPPTRYGYPAFPIVPVP